METTKNKEKMPILSSVAYSVAGAGTGVGYYMVNNYLMLYYTDVVGLTATAISLIMLLARVWDAVNDPMMGVIVDRTHTRFGKFRPWLMIGPPFLAIFNVLTFTVFPLQGMAKTIVCFVCYIGAGMAYTVVQVAVNGLVNRICADPQNKMNLIAISQVANQIVGTVLGASVMTLILYFSKTTGSADARGYFITTIILSIVMVPMMWFGAWKCREITTEEDIAKAASGEKQSLGRSIKAVAQNKQLLALIVCIFFTCIGSIGRVMLLSYYCIYVAGSYALIAPVMSVISFGQLFGNICLPWLTKKFGKKRWFIIAVLLSSVSMVAVFFLPNANAGIIIAISAVYGWLNAASSISNAFCCDCVEYSDYKYGVREDALAFSCLSFAVKLAAAVMGTAGIWMLTAVGYVPNAEQTASTIMGINMIVNILPAVCLVIATLPMIFFYKLDEKKMEEVTTELAKRRNKATEIAQN